MELYEYEREHRDLLRRLAPECMVLLKSDGTYGFLNFLCYFFSLYYL